MRFDQPPVVRISMATEDRPGDGAWPMTVPAVSQLAVADHRTRSTESPLGEALHLQRGVGAARWGFFLRAETMHGFFTYLEENPGAREPRFHEMSHGESFLAVLESRFDSPGFYCLDEPEAALSFSSTLALMATLQRIADDKGQVLCATHSPVLED